MAKRFKRQIKTRPEISTQVVNDSLYYQVKKQADEVNRQLEKLSKIRDINRAVRNPKTGKYERPYKDSKLVSYELGTWASKKLKNRLDTETLKAISDNQVVVNPKATKTQLNAILKALTQFQRSKTSSYKGIKEVREKTIKELGIRLNEGNQKQLSEKDIENMYMMLGSHDMKIVTQFMGASDVWALIAEAKERDLGSSETGREKFLNMMLNHMGDIFDLDVYDSINTIYDNYVME